MITIETRGRASIIGNPSDGYGGAVISCSIKNRAAVTIEPADRLLLHYRGQVTVLKERTDFENRGDCFDIARSVLLYFKLFELKASIKMQTDIPEQAGLAGSTALISSVLLALLKYTGKSFEQHYKAELVRHLEYRYMQCQCGYQDAYMAVFGGLNYIDFKGKEHYRDVNEEPYAVVEPLAVKELPFIVAHGGVKRHSGAFHTPARQRWLAGERKVIEAYSKIATMAREAKDALLCSDWPRLAHLMNENYRLQNSIADSGENNNRLVQAALAGGALAAKLAGAGGGGSVIALTFDADRTRDALLKAGARQFVELDPDYRLPGS